LTLIPSFIEVTLSPGESIFESKEVILDAVPGELDVLIALDTTGSMAPGTAQLGSSFSSIVTGLLAITDAKVGLVSFKDFCRQSIANGGPGPLYADCGCTDHVNNPGAETHYHPEDYPDYAMLVAMTASDAPLNAAVAAIQAVPSGSPGGIEGGGDAAEDYSLVFKNSVDDTSVNWRAASRKFLCVLGDAEPHNAGGDGIANCTDTTPDPHGLDAPTQLAYMASNHRTLIMCLQDLPFTTSATLAGYTSIAALAYTGGAAFTINPSLATNIVDAVSDSISVIEDVHLEVIDASPAPATTSWITPPDPVGPVTPPADFPAGNIEIAVPLGTPAGTYTFHLVALADGANVGEQEVIVHVLGGLGVYLPVTTLPIR